MAIVKNSRKVSRLEGDFYPCTDSMEDEDGSSMLMDSADGSVSGDGASDADSGMGSDEFDLSEVGEPGMELCQVGNESVLLSQELYELPNLGLVLSLKAWNQLLTEEERFALAEYLPDMDQENFALTLKELFSGSNIYFGSPLEVFFNHLKGGLCNPSVVLYRKGLNIFQRHQHYQQLCEYQNSMVGNLVYIRDLWQNCSGYGIEERVRLLNILRNPRNLSYDRNGELGLETDYGSSDSTEACWSRRFSNGHEELNSWRKASFNAFSQSSRTTMQPVRSGKAKGILKVAAMKVPAKMEDRRSPGIAGRSILGTMEANSVSSKLLRRNFLKRHAHDKQTDFGVADFDEYVGKSGYINNHTESVQAVTIASYDCKTLNKMITVKDSDKDQKVPAFHPAGPRSFDDSNIRGKKWKVEDDFRTSKSGFGSMLRSCKRHPAEWSSSHFRWDYTTKNLQSELRRKSSQHEGDGVEYSRPSLVKDQSEETQSDSSEKVEAYRDMYSYSSKAVFSNLVMEVHEPEIKLEDLKFPSKRAKSSEKVSQPTDGGMIDRTLEVEPHSRKVKMKARMHKGETDHSGEANDLCDNVRGVTNEAEGLDLNARLSNTEKQTNRAEKKSQISTDFVLEDFNHERASKPNLACNSQSKKRKGKGDEPNRLIADSSTMKMKRGRKTIPVVVTPSVVSSEPIAKRGSELEMDMKTRRKSFTLITPTIHTGFSFSIIHLLSAVRKALITAQMEDTEDIGNHLRADDAGRFTMAGEQKKLLQIANGDSQSNLPSLRVQEIVNIVKSDPGDPCILETAEPLHDLVRGVLKIFSSKTAPLGAKGWKALTLYEKSIKSWSWVGPVSSNSSEIDNAEEETSAEAWAIPHKMLVKLVDAFANWLKSSQDILQQIGNLPLPPPMLPVVDNKDRFRDLRAQKSLNTISPSSEESRAYFRREEFLRYSIPDRAFQYTTYNGRKSIVAPIRRGGGKLTSKARDHYMLKPDRPPHVTVLCLVRDAAARLPGGIGTRADVCTLIRDSQYVVEDVSDSQVNQVISGALDRLHYERDPCVQFDGERKLWVYLHGDREEEDFEDDGTSSTKKWKRQRKEHLNTVLSDVNMNEKGELFCDDMRPKRENIHSYVDAACSEIHTSNSIDWGVSRENQMVCQENSTDHDFDDEGFVRERAVDLLSAGLF
ncbi:uncharacterized protein LOC110028063 [Phalaenopsis equestris]|uniref:uncharacterized protein LOC110028063 n=1 Tax=Phalaenopsis equestris TaxID=78828 RepID=UPI0009E603E0|nr:uncharacterized protein LOC110028063 [Phalaenopsis equestris]